MKLVRTVAQLRTTLAEPRRAGRTIGLVPTMGALHQGHLSLIDHARAACEIVVVSLFVNPAQFNDVADLQAYPRDEARDGALAAEHGADLLFAPEAQEVYPPGFCTQVSVSGLTERLEGEHRGHEHFDGVTTVVAKLLNMTGPDIAFFGQKDAQQAVVLARMVRDLDMPVEVRVCPTVREPDGLAMSSRNVRLSEAERMRATALHRALQVAAQAVRQGERDPAVVRRRALQELAQVELTLEYLELVTPDTLEPVGALHHDTLAVVAARVGATRLIDNHPLVVAGAPRGSGHEETTDGRP